MSDIRFNQWLHQSGTGGVSQVASGAVGVGTTNPLSDFYVRGDAQITGILTAGHISLGSSITFGDDDRIYLGDGTDFQLYHASSDNNSYIVESGAGGLVVNASLFHVKNAANNEDIAKFSQGGNNELYFSNSKKLETTTNGVTVTGQGVFSAAITASTYIQGTSSNGGLKFYSDSSASKGVTLNTDDHLIPSHDSNSDLGLTGTRWRNVYADTLYGDGSNLTGITGTTINANTNNYLITGTGTANTLQGESGLTFDGTTFTTAGSGGIHISNSGADLTMNSSGTIFTGDGGNATDPAVANGSDTNTGYFYPAADTLAFTTGGGERLRIRDNGYVDMVGGSDVRFCIGNTGTAGTNNSNWIRGSGANFYSNAASGYHKWEIGGSERMQLDSSGNLFLRASGTRYIVMGSSGDATSGGANNNMNWIRGNATNVQYNTCGGFHGWEISGSEKVVITDGGKLGIGHHSHSQIAKELTIRPANDGGIQFVRPGETSGSPNVHLELTTTTSGSAFPTAEAYTVKYRTMNCDQIFETYEGGGTGGNISFRTSESNNQHETMRIHPDGHVTVMGSGPWSDPGVTDFRMSNGNFDIADDTTVTLSSATNTGALICVGSYKRSGGSITYASALFFATYGSSTVTRISDPRNIFRETDTDGYVCVYKSSPSNGHIYVKNRIGTTNKICVNIIGLQGL